ncbi:MAG: AbgT family transporter, partial [Porticoccaceae bacterium]|nr:AbgT family transporter [Porticoccaceae bacterium]
MTTSTDAPPTLMNRLLNKVEVVGNKLPDPAILFLYALMIVWVLSWLLSGVDFGINHPKTGAPLEVTNLLTGTELAGFLSTMVTTFTSFAPLGVVLVAMLGVGVADESKFINTGLKLMLRRTPTALLTPMVILMGLLSHSAIDAGYVLVIPLGSIIFYAAGRHPLAGIAAAFAGVSGGFSANPAPSALDPLLQGFTQPAAHIIDPNYLVNPLCNYFFTAISSVLVIALGWFLTDKVLEPRLQKTTQLNDDIEAAEDLSTVTPQEKKAFMAAALTMLAGMALLVFVLLPADSPFRDPDGSLNSFQAPIMKSIVPL